MSAASRRIFLAAVVWLTPGISFASPAVADLLRMSGKLTLSQPSANLCDGLAGRKDVLPCTDDGEMDTLKVESRPDGSYGVQIERREAGVAYDPQSEKWYAVPYYCSFGGRGTLQGNTISITDNEAEDGEPVEGFALILGPNAVTVADVDFHASKYCGVHADWSGLIFQSPVKVNAKKRQ